MAVIEADCTGCDLASKQLKVRLAMARADLQRLERSAIANRKHRRRRCMRLAQAHAALADL